MYYRRADAGVAAVLRRETTIVSFLGRNGSAYFAIPRPSAPTLRYCALRLAAFMPRSIRRRRSSEREGLSGSWAAQASMAAIVAAGRRKVMCGSWPVAGRPRFFCVTFLLDAFIFSCNVKYVTEANAPLRF